MIDIPKRYHCNTGEGGSAYGEMERFFEAVKAEIGIPNNSPDPYETRVHNHEQSDDTTHTLLYKEKPVATVLETRDEMNWVNFTYFLDLEGLIE